MSDAKKKADNKYRKENVRQIIMRFFPTEQDQAIYEWIKSKDNMNEYLKSLVLEDMNRAK